MKSQWECFVSVNVLVLMKFQYIRNGSPKYGPKNLSQCAEELRRSDVSEFWNLFAFLYYVLVGQCVLFWPLFAQNIFFFVEYALKKLPVVVIKEHFFLMSNFYHFTVISCLSRMDERKLIFKRVFASILSSIWRSRTFKKNILLSCMEISFFQLINTGAVRGIWRIYIEVVFSKSLSRESF